MAESSVKSTVVSVVPFEIEERKPGLYPGYFKVPAAVDGEPQVLVIDNAVHYVYLDETRGSLQVRVPSYEIAASIVNDYCGSQLAVEVDGKPGIFWVTGEVAAKDVKTKYPRELMQARELQKRWFLALVKIADDDWARYHQHKSISDFQRYAARSLNLDREWLLAPETIAQCPACKNNVPVGAIVCPNCRCVIDKEAHKTLVFAA